MPNGPAENDGRELSDCEKTFVGSDTRPLAHSQHVQTGTTGPASLSLRVEHSGQN